MVSRWGLVLLLVAACGRVGFDPGGSAGDAADEAGTPGLITWRKALIARDPPYDISVDTFDVQAAAAGDAVVLQVACLRATKPTGVTVTAPGWTFVPLDPIFGSVVSQLWAASFTAFTPDTAVATVTVTWAQVCGASNELGDEFGNVDPAGGAITFDSHVQTEGTGGCTGTVTTGHASEAVWAACTSRAFVTATGPGYTLGADNADGDWSEYKITSDPAGTPHTPSFENQASAEFVMSVTTLKPR